MSQFLSLKRKENDKIAHKFSEKVTIFKNRFFSISSEADFSDIENMTYSKLINQNATIFTNKIATMIRQFKAFKISEVSQISNLILQTKLFKLLSYLHCLFNVCVKLLYHSQLYKLANTLILKKSDKNDYIEVKTYRLIALLNTVKKALKAIMTRRLSTFAETHDMLFVCQMKVRKSRFTKTALKLLMKQIHTV